MEKLVGAGFPRARFAPPARSPRYEAKLPLLSKTPYLGGRAFVWGGPRPPPAPFGPGGFRGPAPPPTPPGRPRPGGEPGRASPRVCLGWGRLSLPAPPRAPRYSFPAPGAACSRLSRGALNFPPLWPPEKLKPPVCGPPPPPAPPPFWPITWGGPPGVLPPVASCAGLQTRAAWFKPPTRAPGFLTNPQKGPPRPGAPGVFPPSGVVESGRRLFFCLGAWAEGFPRPSRWWRGASAPPPSGVPAPPWASKLGGGTLHLRPRPLNPCPRAPPFLPKPPRGQIHLPGFPGPKGPPKRSAPKAGKGKKLGKAAFPEFWGFGFPPVYLASPVKKNPSVAPPLGLGGR